MTDYEYQAEITDTAPRAPQPDAIKVSLKGHQLAGLYKAILMEKKGTINYNHRGTVSYTNGTQLTDQKIIVSTNIGIFGDIVGYGKTLTALALVASLPINEIHVNNQLNMSYCNPKTYSYMSYSTINNNVLKKNNIINSTLIVVPRGPVYVQWEKSLKDNTNLKYIAIDNLKYIKKNLPENTSTIESIIEYFNKYDVVLIKNTTLDILISHYGQHYDNEHLIYIPIIRRWKRIMIDEAHDICNGIQLMYYEFLWLITASYESLPYSIRTYRNILFHMKESINSETIGMILVKGKKEFVRNSFMIPVPCEKYYLCKMLTCMNVIKNFICASVLEKINANDIDGAIKDLGGKTDTEKNIVELVTKEIDREISNKEFEREYIRNLDIPHELKASKIKTIENDILAKKTKLQNLKERISELNTKMCPICMYDIENPIILECTHSYCMSCIVKWIGNNMNCPECRSYINTQKMISITSNDNLEKSNVVPHMMSKTETLISIIKNNTDGKYLVFSKYDNNFNKLSQILNENDITCSEMKGNTAHMMKVLEKFRSGNIKVILLNTHFAGSGIDIQCATDVVIFHSMGLEKYQAIGRAQRVGRKDTLNIHYLCYEHEMNS